MEEILAETMLLLLTIRKPRSNFVTQLNWLYIYISKSHLHRYGLQMAFLQLFYPAIIKYMSKADAFKLVDYVNDQLTDGRNY